MACRMSHVVATTQQCGADHRTLKCAHVQLQRRQPRAVLRVSCQLSPAGSGGAAHSLQEELALRSGVGAEALEPEQSPSAFTPRQVAVFWDLDNKPPKNIPPYDAALHLTNLASGFGEVVDVVAYANRHAFSFVPEWVREQRRDRKRLDQLEVKGLVQVAEPYVCSLCGRKCRNNLLLKKHFKQLHERERNKRLSRLDQLKGKKRVKFREKHADREVRYKEAARGIIMPKVGYGLATELRRAGVFVRTVQDQPQAADIALKRHMLQSFRQGVRCICLVSDDSDFGDILKMARYQKLRTVVVGDTKTLKSSSDMWFSWDDVSSGRARLQANEDSEQWANEDALAKDLLDDEFLDDRDAVEIRLKERFGRTDDLSYSVPIRVSQVSAFSDEDAQDASPYSWETASDSDDDLYYSSDEISDEEE